MPRVLILAAVTAILVIEVKPSTSLGATVDLRDYIIQSANGNMLCQSDGAVCLVQHFNQYGEFQIDYSIGITDYVARSSGKNVLLGVIRSGTSSDLRCFSQSGSLCSAPSNADFVPESIPLITGINVVSAQTELSAENPDGTPRAPIVGDTTTNGGMAYSFGVIGMNESSCAQTYEGDVVASVHYVYVQQVAFGGDIGTQDAVVIDEYENGPTQSQDHVERYFYVQGYGRVREASSYFDPNTGFYDKPLGGNSTRNIVRANSLSYHQTQCPQGSVSGLQ